MMKRILPLLILGIFACGQPSSRTDRKTELKEKTEEKDTKTHEYIWYKNFSDYYRKKIAIYGFMWMDTIRPELPDGRYTVYERPNCHGCKEVKVLAKVPLPISDIDDTTFTNTSTTAQWRLVKIIAWADDYDYATIERIERSEYSYPDYPGSGYRKITNGFLDSIHGYKDPCWVEGYIKVKSLAFQDDYLFLGITGTGLKKEITIYIRKGKGPNEAEELPNQYTQADLKVRDKDGKLVKGKKVRLYGVWDDYMDAEPDESPGYMHVEMIEVVK